MRRLLRRPLTWVVLVVATIGAVIALFVFTPWKLFTHSRVDEPVPVAIETGEPATPTIPTIPTTQLSQPAAQEAPKVVPPAQPEVLAEGRFVNQEHRTSGTARVLRLADGSRVLRLENFSTSDGPELHVWLTDIPAGGPDKSFDDGRHIHLGNLKATDGNQNYPIPADADLNGIRSAVIWCYRFNVAFGSAPLSL